MAAPSVFRNRAAPEPPEPASIWSMVWLQPSKVPLNTAVELVVMPMPSHQGLPVSSYRSR